MKALDKKKEGYYIYNHVDLDVWFNPTGLDQTGNVNAARIVRIKVKPRSIDHAVS
jgi:hypothetical protein